MTGQRTRLWVPVLGIIFTIMKACSTPRITPCAPPSAPLQSDVMKQILDQPARFESKTVTIKGVFRGWRGPCRTSPPASRSDWMVAGPSGCLYVNGPVPPGLDPARPSGEKVTVTGVVRLKMGMPYLKEVH